MNFLYHFHSYIFPKIVKRSVTEGLRGKVLTLAVPGLYGESTPFLDALRRTVRSTPKKAVELGHSSTLQPSILDWMKHSLWGIWICNHYVDSGVPDISKLSTGRVNCTNTADCPVENVPLLSTAFFTAERWCNLFLVHPIIGGVIGLCNCLVDIHSTCFSSPLHHFPIYIEISLSIKSVLLITENKNVNRENQKIMY